MRRYRANSTQVDVYLPTNFYIEPTEYGYEVIGEYGTQVARASSWHEACAALPDGAQEELATMHGVVLDAQLRQAILVDGFFVWGTGVGKAIEQPQ